MVQVVPFGKLAEQSSVSLKAPVTEMLEMVSGPTALSVIVWGGLTEPTLARPKLALPVDVFRAAKALMPRTRKLYWSATRKLPEASTEIPVG